MFCLPDSCRHYCGTLKHPYEGTTLAYHQGSHHAIDPGFRRSSCRVVHFLIAAAEMFAWKQPRVSRGLKEKLGLSQVEAEKVMPIVANAGLYNAFIASGLVWSTTMADNVPSAKYFFLICVAIAGLYGAATLRWTTLIFQTLPALIAIALIYNNVKL